MRRLLWSVFFCVLSLALLAGINYSFGKTVEGAKRFPLILSAEQIGQIAEIRYQPSAVQDPITPEQFVKSFPFISLPPAGRDAGGKLWISLPFSYSESGLVLPRRQSTAPLPQAVWLAIRTVDGQILGMDIPLITASGGMVKEIRIPAK
jgi:hypothetical protein